MYIHVFVLYIVYKKGNYNILEIPEIEKEITFMFKGFSCCHKIRFLFPIFAIQNRRTLIFQTMDSVWSNNLTLKYEKCTPSGCKDRRIDTITEHTAVQSDHLCTMYIVHTVTEFKVHIFNKECQIMVGINYFCIWELCWVFT